MRTLLAFTKQNLEDPEEQYQSPIGEDLREMLTSFHQELLRHSNHPPPEEDETTKVEDSTAANAKQVCQARCSGKFVAPENYSHTQQYELGLRLRIRLNLGLRLGLALALVTL